MRTILQHAWASISHSLDYKYGQDAPVEVRRKLFQVAALIEIGDSLFQGFKEDLEAVREDYKSSMLGKGWRKLEINLESLVTSWEKWRPVSLGRELLKRGYSIVLNPIEGDLDGYPDPEFLSQFGESEPGHRYYHPRGAF